MTTIDLSPQRVGAPSVTIADLTIAYRTDLGELAAVTDVSLELPAGTITGLVGESPVSFEVLGKPVLEVK